MRNISTDHSPMIKVISQRRLSKPTWRKDQTKNNTYIPTLLDEKHLLHRAFISDQGYQSKKAV